MNEQPVLNEREWQIVLELLENERQELPSEIRHTRSHELHAQLEQRLHTVDELIERVRAHAAV